MLGAIPNHRLMKSLFIPGNVPSSKNSKQWTGKFLVSSKTTRRYENNTWLIYKTYAAKFKSIVDFYRMKPPFHIGLFFVRDSHRSFDYINACQIIADLMRTPKKNTDKGFGWIPDDDADNFVPVFLGYSVDKQNAGVHIVPIKSYSELYNKRWIVRPGFPIEAVVDNPRA